MGEEREGAYRAAEGKGERRAHLARAYLEAEIPQTAAVWESPEAEAYCRGVSETASLAKPTDLRWRKRHPRRQREGWRSWEARGR